MAETADSHARIAGWVGFFGGIFLAMLAIYLGGSIAENPGISTGISAVGKMLGGSMAAGVFLALCAPFGGIIFARNVYALFTGYESKSPLHRWYSIVFAFLSLSLLMGEILFVSMFNF